MKKIYFHSTNQTRSKNFFHKNLSLKNPNPPFSSVLHISFGQCALTDSSLDRSIWLLSSLDFPVGVVGIVVVKMGSWRSSVMMLWIGSCTVLVLARMEGGSGGCHWI